MNDVEAGLGFFVEPLGALGGSSGSSWEILGFPWELLGRSAGAPWELFRFEESNSYIDI